MKGIITKGISGFYYVDTEDGTFECKAKGRFRKDLITPLVGDYVEIDVANGYGNIRDILPRNSEFIRPPVANINQLIVTFAVKSPEPNLNMIDKLTVIAAHKGIDVVILITKTDLQDCAEYENIYKNYFKTVCTNLNDTKALMQLSILTKGKISAFAGCSGVGKSSVLNAFNDQFTLKTGGLSLKIERGKHTTRHVELLKLDGGGYVLDTPGFSTLKLPYINALELKNLFPEFAEYEGKCRFRGCSHVSEPDCMVLDALSKGNIARKRHEHYLEFYNELKQIKEWQVND